MPEKIKPGNACFFSDADARFSMDFGKSGLRADRPAETRQYNRYMMYLSMGYKYDFVGMIQELVSDK
jgi:hypothetical protein